MAAYHQGCINVEMYSFVCVYVKLIGCVLHQLLAGRQAGTMLVIVAPKGIMHHTWQIRTHAYGMVFMQHLH
jgi:hypothetical protein